MKQPASYQQHFSHRQRQRQQFIRVIMVVVSFVMTMFSALMVMIWTRLLTFVSCFRSIYKLFVHCWQRWTGPILTMENGMQISVGPQIGEGGFSFVYEATIVATGMVNSSSSNNNNTKCALKRIYIGSDTELRQSCMKEADVHHTAQHDNLMPLLGFLRTNEYCYMLFPLCSHSLRKEVNQRTGLLDKDDHQSYHLEKKYNTTTSPWSSELQILQLFLRICSAVQALHDVNYTHRDIKLENILLLKKTNKNTNMYDDDDDNDDYEPILMDFGSAGPLTVALNSRHDIMSTIELAAQQTTLPYRPPELLDATGLLHVGDTLDYRAVDVWSLGCTLFAILYGASPMECEFSRNNNHNYNHNNNGRGGGGGGGGGSSGGVVKIVECTTLRILNDRIPTPPLESPAASWYSNELTIDFIPSLLQQDRNLRPTLPTILSRLCTMIEARRQQQQESGGVPVPTTTSAIMLRPWEQEQQLLLLRQQGTDQSNNDNDDDDGFTDFYSSSTNPV